MAQTGYVPISLYYSTTAATAPTAANLVSGELAINITDGILFYKDNAGVVQTLATKAATSGSYTSITLTGGTANGVPYLNASKVLTTGSALTFDGTNFAVGSASAIGGGVVSAQGDLAAVNGYVFKNSAANYGNTNNFIRLVNSANATVGGITHTAVTSLGIWGNTETVFLLGSTGATEGMRLTSTGLGIGTSSPAAKLDVNGVILMPNNVAFKFKDSGGTARNTFYLDASNNLQIQNNVNNGNVAQTLYGTGVYLWSNSSTELMRLNSSGNLGIGTSSPGARLDAYTATTGVGGWSYNGQFTAPNYPLFRLGATTPNKYSSIGNNADGGFTFIVNGSSSAIGTEAMYLTAAGNLGLGVTPSAWVSSVKAFDVGSAAASYYSGGVTHNAYFDATDSRWEYKGTGPATFYNVQGGTHAWSIAASGTAGNAITFTQAMTLDTSGNLGIGTTSPGAKLDIQGTVSAGGSLGLRVLDTTNSLAAQLFRTGSTYSYAGVGALETWLYSQGTSNLSLGPDGAGAVKIVTNGFERARIDSSGNLLVGKTSSSANGDGAQLFPSGTIGLGHTSGTVTATAYAAFGYAGGGIGSITQNGTTAVAYNTTSDYRLKDNQAPLTGSGEFIDALQPKTWNWKQDGSKGVGFIAHEVQAVSPNSVVGEKDAVDEDGKPRYQAMEYGSAEFIANIIAELQSLRKRVAQLEGK